jgi:hypothetical protein
VILESWETRFAGAQDQSLAAGSLMWIFESSRAAGYTEWPPLVSLLHPPEFSYARLIVLE